MTRCWTCDWKLGTAGFEEKSLENLLHESAYSEPDGVNHCARTDDALFGEALGFDPITSTQIFGGHDAVLAEAMITVLMPRLSQTGLLCTS